MAFSVVLFMAVWLGRATFLESAGLSLVWPASGIGAVWLITSGRARLPADLVALALVTMLAVVATQGSPRQALLSGVLAVIQPLVYVALMRRLAPQLWGSGGTRTFARVANVGPFLVACTAASAVGSAVRWTGLGLVPPGDPTDLVVVWTRNFAWMVAIASLALQLAPAMAQRMSPADLLRQAHTVLFDPSAPRRGLEGGAIFLVTAALYWTVFARSAEIPSTFLLMLTTVWASVRLAPTSANLQAMISGTIAVLFTLDDRGAFVSLSNPRSSATLAQLFLIVLIVLTLTLAFSTSEKVDAITRATASERAEAERAALLNSVLQSMQEGVEVVQADGRAVVRNRAGSTLLGQAQSKTQTPSQGPDTRPAPGNVAHTPLFTSDGSRVAYQRLPFVRALAGEEVSAEDYWIHDPDLAARRILEITATPVPRLVPSEPNRAVITFRDVTIDRQDRDSLASFAGVVAHDLINPLGVVRGWADLLAEGFSEGRLDPRQGMEMVAGIQGSAAQMLLLIDDLLAYSVARDRPLNIEELDLSVLAQRIAHLREDRTNAVIDIQPRIRAKGDRALVRQLIDNLIANAVKYVAPGVRPRIKVTSENRGAMLEVSVSDNGIGIPTGHRDRIFDNFHRAHASDYPGTGIGLAICRRVIERHGGQIQVHDGPQGTGSTFVFSLPRSQCHEPF